MDSYATNGTTNSTQNAIRAIERLMQSSLHLDTADAALTPTSVNSVIALMRFLFAYLGQAFYAVFLLRSFTAAAGRECSVAFAASQGKNFD